MDYENFNKYVEKREKLVEQPKLILYLLRHGESEKDKSKSTRGLTEKGQTEVREAMANIFNDLVSQHNPEFNDWDNPTALEPEVAKAVRNIEFHLRDSGTDRTIQQVMIEFEELINRGVLADNIYLPKGVIEHQNLEPDENAGPGVAKRLEGVRGLDFNPEFRIKIDSKEYQQKVQASSTMMAWANAPEDDVPENIETRSQMEKRYQKDIKLAEKVIKKKTKGYDRQVVVITNSHASMATLAAAQELDIPIDTLMGKIKQVPCAQGLKYNFYEGDREHQTEPFGEELEQAVDELKSE